MYHRRPWANCCFQQWIYCSIRRTLSVQENRCVARWSNRLTATNRGPPRPNRSIPATNWIPRQNYTRNKKQEKQRKVKKNCEQTLCLATKRVSRGCYLNSKSGCFCPSILIKSGVFKEPDSKYTSSSHTWMGKFGENVVVTAIWHMMYRSCAGINKGLSRRFPQGTCGLLQSVAVGSRKKRYTCRK